MLVRAAAAMLALLVLATVALAVDRPASYVSPAVSTLSTEPVGPAGGSAGPSARVALPSAGGASQVVSGITASTSAVRFSSAGQPLYDGTEPGMMTLERNGSELIVTVAPR